jgi:hypothetical protein
LQGEDFGVVQEAVEDGGGAGDVAEEFAPIFEGAVAGHERGAGFVAAEDDFEETFAGAFGELLHAHVVDDEEIGLEVTCEDLVVAGEGFVVEEVADDIEDGAIEDGAALLDDVESEGLDDVTFSDAGRSEQENVAMLAEETSGGEVEDLLLGELRIEGPVEGVEGFEIAEAGGIDASLDLSIGADEEFVLEEEFKEVGMAELVGLCFVESDVEALSESGESELAKRGGESVVHGVASKVKG